MERRRPKTLHQLLATLGTAAVAAGAWAGWLGWDQHRDVQPDGSTTGPYEAWQVIGLVLSLLPLLYWATSRHHYVAAVFGISLGLTVSTYVDWSDDASGLFVIGVGMVLVGSFATTAALSAVIGAVLTATRRNGPASTASG
jgi:hypothetical protein